MIQLLAKIFIPDRENVSSPEVRKAYGMLCGAVGIFLNIILFIGKIIVGTMICSIAITADAFNNLSDAGSSLITLIGFRLAGQRPDSGHPFGHGRFEYISGLLVSMLIILMGFELGKSSIEKIITPEDTSFSVASVIVLAVSIIIKLYMNFYNRSVGKKLGSTAMKVTALDSLSDSIATAAVLVCMIITKLTNINLDGWCGAAVALFILIGGVRAAIDTINPLLGQPPSEELVNEIEEIVTSHEGVLGIHDLVIHDYGPGRMMISLHAEVPSDADLLKTHDTIDNIEKELSRKLDCETVIHMDPIETDNVLTMTTREKIAELVQIIDERVTIHDFRMVTGPTHTNVIFDIVVPYDVRRSEAEIRHDVEIMVKTLDENYFAVVNVDKSFVK